MKITLSLALAAVLSLAIANNASACVTFQAAFNPTFKGNVNWDLNDYGRIHHDADDPNCAQAAMYSLTDKLNQQLDAGSTTFQQWLDGYVVAEIYASAMRIGANGWANKDLDDQLVELSARFSPNVDEPSGTCGGDNFNTCMDDLLADASAYSWMAAYMTRRPNRFTSSQVNTTIGLAEDYLHRALKPVSSAEPKNGICLRVTPVTSNGYTPLCTGTIAQLNAGTAETFTVNGQQQLLHYGFGLMTSVASAKLGLELAGSSFTFSTDETAIAKALMQEVQRHYNSSTHGYNAADCIQRHDDGFGNITYPTVDCGAGYLPDMYALLAFYDDRLGGVPTGTYDSNSFNANLFHLEDQYDYMPDMVTKVDKQQFSYGRFETYGIEGYAWWVSNPPRTWMPYDNNDAHGWVDTISSTGLASGWACDRDAPDGRILIDFYSNNGLTKEATATADQYSGTAYDSQCGSGIAHRFAYQLPSSSQGKVLRAWALDYTWYGATEIGCSQTPTCSW